MKQTNTIERYPFFSFEVREEGKLITKEWELPKRTKLIKGIQLSTRFYNHLFLRGSQKIEIGGDEIFGDGFISRALLSTGGVSPQGRFFPLGTVLPGDFSVKFRFKDVPHPQVFFMNGYDVQVMFLTEERI